jgi:hypothetical protein
MSLPKLWVTEVREGEVPVRHRPAELSDLVVGLLELTHAEERARLPKYVGRWTMNN